jgi:hypothetical protein
MIKTYAKYGYGGTLEDLVEAFPDLKCEAIPRDDPGDMHKHTDYVIDASDFDVNKIGRFMTSDNNVTILVKGLTEDKLLQPVLAMFRKDGKIAAAYDEIIEGHARWETEQGKSLIEIEKSRRTDPWNCRIITNSQYEFDSSVTSRILWEGNILPVFNKEGYCNIYINSKEYRVKTTLYKSGCLAYRQFGLNQKVVDLEHDQPQDVSIISPAVNEMPILYRHIQYLRQFGEVGAGSRDNQVYPKGGKFGYLSLKFSKLGEKTK